MVRPRHLRTDAVAGSRPPGSARDVSGPAADSDRRVLGTAIATFVALGMPKAAVAVAWPSMAESFGRPAADLGLLIAVYIAGFMVAAPVSGHVIVRLGTGRVVLAASAASVVALAGYAAAPSWIGLLAAALLLGFSGGFIDPGLNAYVAIHHDVRTMGWVHAGFGVGAALGPLLATTLLGLDLSWRLGFWVLAVIQLAVTAALGSAGAHWRSPPPTAGRRAKGLYRLPIVLAVLAVFLIYTGVEVGTGQWAFTLFTEHRGISEAAAGLAVTSFWIALTGARILLGVAGHRASLPVAASVSGVMAASALTLMWWSPADWVDLLALVAAGAALGPLFPLHMQLTPLRVGAETAAVMVGYQMVAASAGAFLVPGGIGLAAGAAGLGVIAPLLVGAAAALVITGEAVRRLTR